MKTPAVLVIIFLVIAGLFSYKYFGSFNTAEKIISVQTKQPGVLLVGTDATYPPLEFVDSQGKIAGFDMDLVGELARRFGLRLEVKNISFDNIFDELTSSKIDMIASSVTITSERLTKYAFSSPYFNAGQVVVVRKDSEVKNTLDLKGLRVGAQAETTSLTEAQKLTDPKMVKTYANYTLASTDLADSKIEAIIIDYPAGVGLVQANDQLMIVGEPFTQEFYGLVLRKGDKALLSAVDEVIANLKQSGKLGELRKKWKLQ